MRPSLNFWMVPKMKFYSIKFKLKHITNNVNVKTLENYLLNLLFHMKQQSNLYFQSSGYDSVVETLKNHKPNGSLNQFGRSLGIQPQTPYHHQAYNFAEMFRNNVLQATMGYVQKLCVSELENIELKKAYDEFKEKFPNVKRPTTVSLRKMLQYRDKAVKPSCNVPILTFHAADNHYASTSIDLERNVLIFKLNVPKTDTAIRGEQVNIEFKIPTGKRFKNILKLCKPTVYLNEQDEIIFNFAVEVEDNKLPQGQNVLAVDSGLVEPFVATPVVDGVVLTPFFANHNINRYRKQIEHLYENHAIPLLAKAEECERCNHKEKADVLWLERKRILSTITRLKNEMATQTAVLLSSIADQFDATIVFENLKWLEHKGGKWNHSVIQSKTEYIAKRKVMRVSAANTSQNCSKCEAKKSMSFTGRIGTCTKCGNQLDRDINASRNIAQRAIKKLAKNAISENRQLGNQPVKEVKILCSCNKNTGF